jgi:hypothetical protein
LFQVLFLMNLLFGPYQMGFDGKREVVDSFQIRYVFNKIQLVLVALNLPNYTSSKGLYQVILYRGRYR